MSMEVFLVNNDPTNEAQQILEAITQIQQSPELQAEAAEAPERLLDRLNLHGLVRSAVALAVTGAVVGSAQAPHMVQPNGWWSN